jgi:predicted nucleic acid-binding protein
MILADTSVWIHHFRKSDPLLVSFLEEDRVLMHPFVLGELAMGSLRDRELVLFCLSRMRSTSVASAEEVLTLVDSHKLYGSGIGYIDAHLLAATLATGIAELRLWTRDRRLWAVAKQLGVASEISGSQLQ